MGAEDKSVATSIINTIKNSLEERRSFFLYTRKEISPKLDDTTYRECLVKTFDESNSKYFLDFLLGISDEIYPK